MVSTSRLRRRMGGSVDGMLGAYTVQPQKNERNRQLRKDEHTLGKCVWVLANIASLLLAVGKPGRKTGTRIRRVT